MKRRKFLQTSATSAVTLPLVLNGLQVSAYPKSPLYQLLNIESDKVLVLIQLSGGNDGLNTIIPLDQYDNLANARSNVLIPESAVIPVNSETAFHPSMGGIKNLFDDARMSIIQSVGYPNQNRSHFRSTDIWTTASEADEYLTTGWMGRYFDSLHPSYPDGYPNGQFPDPIAITIDSLVSETCQGVGSNFSLALTDPFSLGPLTIGEEGDVPDTPYGYELAYIRQVMQQTNAYADVVGDAANNGNTLSTHYPDDNRLAQQLKIVAQLVSGGLKTKVYVCNIGGFDTHANQVVDGDPLVGEHATLLQTLSDAVYAFQDDLKLLGIEEKVISMTFSEFGRQIKSNNSLGTDHGSAAPMMVFGKCINPVILGDNPEIPAQVEDQEGVPMQYDFRSVYGSVLMDWFEVAESEVKSLLFDDFQYIPILQPCTVTSTEALSSSAEELQASCFPNPFENVTTIRFTSKAEWVKVSIYNALGIEIKVLASGKFPSGTHEVRFEAHDLPSGNYYFRIQTERGQKTKGVVKQ